MSHLVNAKGHLKAHIYSEGLISSLIDEIKSLPKIQSLKLDPAVTQLVVSKLKAELQSSADRDLRQSADIGEMAVEVLSSVFQLSEDEKQQVRNQLSYIRENRLDKTPSIWKRIRAAIYAFFFTNA